MTTPDATSVATPTRESATEGSHAAAAPRVPAHPAAPRVSRRALTDDEILGLVDAPPANSRSLVGRRADLARDDNAGGLSAKDYARPASSNSPRAQSQQGIIPNPTAPADDPDSTTHDGGADGDEVSAFSSSDATGRELPSELPPEAQAALAANPDLRRAWDDAHAYRETFSTPDAARQATTRLADLDRLDALFFSPRAEDHVELARVVASLDPAAFASLAHAMQSLASANGGNESSVGAQHAAPAANAWRDAAHPPSAPAQEGVIPSEARNLSSNVNAPGQSQPTPAQTEFFHAANAAAVEGVLGAIETQVDRLLPEGISKSARNRVVGEIYRELDSTLQSNRQLAQQIREAFRSGALDAAHQRAIVSLVTGRARQSLPGVAKRVLNEWTSTIVAASQDRRARQRAAERRVDIAGTGGGSDGVRSIAPRDLDYARLSDSDILNL